MKSVDSITKEWRVLEQCSMGFDSNGASKELKELVSDHKLNWAEVIHQALRHSLLPTVSHSIFKNGLVDNVPNEFRDILFSAHLINKRVLEIGYEELVRVVEALDEESIDYVVTKGFTFDSTIYRGKNIRKTNDVDFMFAPKDKNRVFEILKSVGYKPGYFDFESGDILDMPEASMKMYSMVNEFAPEFAIKTSDPIVQSMCVDITCSLTWFNSQYKVDLSDALSSRVRMDIPGHEGKTMPSFNAEYQIVYTALHLFKEAWVEMYGIKDGNDVSLSRFMDMFWLFEHYKDEIDKSKLISIVTDGGIEKPFFWVLKHTDRIFNSNYCESLECDEVSETWLSSWQTKSYKTMYWKGTMRERLQAKDRTGLFINY